MFGANNAQQQKQTVNSDESPILRCFTPDKQEPRLVPLMAIDGPYINALLKWSMEAKRIDPKGLPGQMRGAVIPRHEDFYAMMHMQGDCMKVEVTHKDQGEILVFGVSPNTNQFGNGLWKNFGGVDQQPIGPWCVELIHPDIDDEVLESLYWLKNFQHSVCWMWILIQREMKNVEVTIDPKTGEARVNKKR